MMAQRRGSYTISRVSTGASRGIAIKHLGRRRRSPSDAGDGPLGRRHNGTQHISNAQIPSHRHLEDEIRRAELRGKLFVSFMRAQVLLDTLSAP
jgi:hypothetical protein